MPDSDLEKQLATYKALVAKLVKLVDFLPGENELEGEDRIVIEPARAASRAQHRMPVVVSLWPKEERIIRAAKELDAEGGS